MALVNIVNMLVLDNPTQFTSPFSFEITFECLQELDDDLEWRIVYVGNAKDSDSDIVLDEVLVGPVPVGTNKFTLSCDAPDSTLLPEIVGVTVVLVTCSYRDREFIRVGYYVNNEYIDYDNENENDSHDNDNNVPPMPLDMTKVHRQILADKPRVTKFLIPWGDETEPILPPPSQQDGDDKQTIMTTTTNMQETEQQDEDKEHDEIQ